MKALLVLAEVVGCVAIGAWLALAFAFPFIVIYAVLWLVNVDVGQLTW